MSHKLTIEAEAWELLEELRDALGISYVSEAHLHLIKKYTPIAIANAKKVLGNDTPQLEQLDEPDEPRSSSRRR